MYNIIIDAEDEIKAQILGWNAELKHQIEGVEINKKNKRIIKRVL